MRSYGVTTGAIALVWAIRVPVGALQAVHGHVFSYFSIADAGPRGENAVWSVTLVELKMRHWGTDIDVFDRAAHPPGYRTRLLPDEAGPDGVYARLHAWLDAHAARFGFFRPYRTRRRGMCPAPWHLSHAPSALAALAAIDIDMVARAVRGTDLLGRELVLDMLPDIFRDHVLDVDGPLPAA